MLEGYGVWVEEDGCAICVWGVKAWAQPSEEGCKWLEIVRRVYAYADCEGMSRVIHELPAGKVSESCLAICSEECDVDGGA